MRIVFCGGHHSSALVVAEEFVKRGEEISWFGHKYSMIGDRNPSAEYLEVTSRKIPFYEIKAGKLQKNFKFLLNLLRIPVGIWQSYLLLRKIKPDLIFSFGGYLALPAATGGFLLGIPVVTHEQTVVSGLANKIIAKISKKVFISFPSSEKYFPRQKTVYTGIPLRKEIFFQGKEKYFDNGKRTIYITGGKQGSHIINEALFAIAPQVLEKFNVIHQCGFSSLYSDFEEAKKIKESLGKKAENYLVKDYFFSEEIGKVFNSADFLISRAGAHTVYEIIALNKPSILIPIPWSTHHEQEKNAEFLCALGLAKIIRQEDLKSNVLWQEILNFDKNLSTYRLKKDFSLVRDSTKKIVEEIDKLFN